MNSEIIISICSICAIMGGMFKFFMSRLDKKFEKIDQRFDSMQAHFDNRCDVMEDQLHEINLKISDLNLRICVTETRLEERRPFLNVNPEISKKRRGWPLGRSRKSKNIVQQSDNRT